MVVAQSSVPTPSIVPCSSALASTQAAEASDSSLASGSPTTTVTGSKSGSSVTFSPAVHPEPRVGLEFAMPKSPPPIPRPSKDGRRLRHRSRSSSRTTSHSVSRQCDEVQASIRSAPTKHRSPAPALKRGGGRGRKIVEMTNAPLLIPTVNCHLLGVTKPKEGLTITMTGEGPSTFPTAIQHLSHLDQDASAPLDIVGPALPVSGTTVEFTQEPVQEIQKSTKRRAKSVSPLFLTLKLPRQSIRLLQCYKTIRNSRQQYC